MSVLVADVGGTNTRVGLAQDGRVNRSRVCRYRNTDYATLGDVLCAYIADNRVADVTTVCVAIAGPVRHGVGRLTNRDWIVSETDLCRLSGAGTGLVINDLSAQGYALDAVRIVPAFDDPTTTMDATETRLVVGVGTGFNAAPVYRMAAGLHVVPSECGHITLPVWDADSFQMATMLSRHNGFASVEDVLSGRGLPTCYRLLSGKPAPEDPSEILRTARDVPDSPEARVVRTMVTTLGRVIGDLALTHLPFGGIVLIGGMARALVPFFDTFGFADAMSDKGRFSDFLSNFGIFVLEDDFAALDGCALYAETRTKPFPR